MTSDAVPRTARVNRQEVETRLLAFAAALDGYGMVPVVVIGVDPSTWSGCLVMVSGDVLDDETAVNFMQRALRVANRASDEATVHPDTQETWTE